LISIITPLLHHITGRSDTCLLEVLVGSFCLGILRDVSDLGFGFILLEGFIFAARFAWILFTELIYISYMVGLDLLRIYSTTSVFLLASDVIR
jgi:hypothetical protein